MLASAEAVAPSSPEMSPQPMPLADAPKSDAVSAKGRNFYNDLVCRYGFEKEAAEIQDLYLAGHKDEAAAKVPDEMLEEIEQTTVPFRPTQGRPVFCKECFQQRKFAGAGGV